MYYKQVGMPIKLNIWLIKLVRVLLVILYQCYITENPDSTWEQLKSELSVRFTEQCNPHHALSLLHKARQSKSETVKVYAEKSYTLAHDAFAQLNKAVAESKLADFFIDGLYHDYLWMKIMRENPGTSQTSVQSELAEQNLRK